MTIDYLLIGLSLLLLVSVIASKLSSRLGVPALLIFLLIGMLAGSDGPGGIYFDDPWVAQSLGVIALIFILFAGGLETDWRSVRPVLREGISLATVSVIVTAVLVGAFAAYVAGLSVMQGLLLGAIIASTDAAAVFAVLRSKRVGLKGRLQPLIELESGSNDPTAVFLVTGLIHVIKHPGAGYSELAFTFFQQMTIGALLGYGIGRVSLVLINRLKLEYEGLYPVLTFSLALLSYGITDFAGGSGFLAVYATGLVMGNGPMAHKRSLLRFHDGFAWLMQILMFLTLGLLVFPKQLPPVVGNGLLISGFLMLVARPVSVFLGLAFSSFSWREKAFISWVGLRGAVPIVLATFPMLARMPGSYTIFNLVFFIVITSALLQGTSIPWVARLLKVDEPLAKRRRLPLEFEQLEGVDAELVEMILPYESDAVGKPIVELGLPADSLITLVCRGDNFIVPSGSTVLEGGDVLLVLATKQSLPQVQSIVAKRREEPPIL